MPLSYVDDPVGLQALCARLAQCEWFALDTEFERERTYYPKLCLVQVGTPEWVSCIDPLALDDLSALGEVLTDARVLKVLHACTQDCEVLLQALGCVPAPLFDTQVAAVLAGHGEQLGYAPLVEQRTGVSLPKGHTRTDWSRRPLSDDQLGYARDDVRYLAQLFPALREELAGSGRLGWLDEDFAALADPARYQARPEESWRRVRGLDRLDPAERARAAALAAWRERTAQRIDRPRNWLLRDAALLDLARAAPRDRGEMQAVCDLPPRFVERHGEALLEVLLGAADREPPPATAGRPPPLDAAGQALVRALEKEVRALAGRTGLDPDLLVTRKRLGRLARGEPLCEVLAGWRRSLLAGPLGEVLARNA